MGHFERMNDIGLLLINIGSGVFVTLQLMVVSFFIGLSLGTIIAVVRYKNLWGRFLLEQLISILRGTPLILQLSFIYFILPGFLGVKLSVLTTGMIAFGLNSSAYVAEILRSGIESLPKGQFEAAQTLNIPAFYMWKDIIFPQVLQRVLPSLMNEMISLLKETAIISVIGGLDIMRQAEIIAAERFTYFLPLTIAGFYYYILVRFIEYVGKKVERAYTCSL